MDVDLARCEDTLVDEEADFAGQLEETTTRLSIEVVGHFGFAGEVDGRRGWGEVVRLQRSSCGVVEVGVWFE